MLLSREINAQQTCFEHKQYPRPAISEQASVLYNTKLAEAKVEYEKDTSNADGLIWLGRRTAYLGDYEEAIKIFSKGIRTHPRDARFYRHRGHRYLTLRCIDKAIADFEKASQLIKGKPDEIEPDGLPNAQNVPTSTLQSNVWYHLGLCYYLKGEYTKARDAYRECLAVSTNNDMYVATANWMYITLRKLGDVVAAEKLLETISPGMNLIENKDYYQILLLYKENTSIADPVEYLKSEKKDLGLASFGYGLGNYLLLNGRKEEAGKVFKLILDSNQWGAFGFIAAEVELGRMK
jgi:Tfp pilus assembly protein PilF